LPKLTDCDRNIPPFSDIPQGGGTQTVASRSGDPRTGKPQETRGPQKTKERIAIVNRHEKAERTAAALSYVRNG